MTTAELAIVVTGAVGLGSPIVAQFFESLREKRRFDHERDIRDRDDLRPRLEAMAQSLNSVYAAAAVAYGTLSSEGPQASGSRRTAREAISAVNDARLSLAKLGLWISLDEGAGRFAKDSLDKIDVAVLAIDVQSGLGGYTDDYRPTDVEARQKEASDAAVRFLTQARAKFGARPE